MKKVIQVPAKGKNVIKGIKAAVAPVVPVVPVAPKKPTVVEVKGALDVLSRAGGFRISREILTAADVIL